MRCRSAVARKVHLLRSCHRRRKTDSALEEEEREGKDWRKQEGCRPERRDFPDERYEHPGYPSEEDGKQPPFELGILAEEDDQMDPEEGPEDERKPPRHSATPGERRYKLLHPHPLHLRRTGDAIHRCRGETNLIRQRIPRDENFPRQHRFVPVP